jgi:hypothetical protein
MNKLFGYFLFVFIFITSCKKNPETVDLHYDYFPLEKGAFVEYQVTHMRYGINKPDTTVYKLKTVVGDTVIDNEGRVASKFYRYVYDNLSGSYKIKDLWTAIINENRAELVEENQRVIKMVFAPTIEKEWNINAFNTFDEYLAYYENIHSKYVFNGFSFNETVRVIQEYVKPNLIEYKNKYEVYAKGIGMIEKKFIDIKFNNFDTLKPTGGEQIFFKVINYGKE